MLLRHVLNAAGIDAGPGEVVIGQRQRPGGQHDQFVFMAIPHHMPQLFGDEGHQGMQQAQRAVEDVVHHAEHLRAPGGIVTVKNHLGIFDVPIAVLVPQELVEHVGGIIEAAALEVGLAIDHGLVQQRQDVLVVR